MTKTYNLSIKIFLIFALSCLFQHITWSQTQTSQQQVEAKAQTAKLEKMVRDAQAKGYSSEQIKSLSKRNGSTPEEMAIIEDILSGKTAEVEMVQKEEPTTDIPDEAPPVTSPDPNLTPSKSRKSKLFGYGFFSNTNISFTPSVNLATPKNYTLGPGDLVAINIWGAAEANYDIEISKTGALRIPNVGPVFVNGMSLEDANKVITSKLSTIYGGIRASRNSPYKVFVDVNVSKIRTVQVNIIGQVSVPGTYALNGLSTVLNGLYAAGGPTKQGTLREIKLIRQGEEVSYFDFYKYLVEGSQEGNLTLQDQDVIVIAPYVSRVTVTGEVKRPGIYEMLPSENLNDLLTYAGNFTSNAYKDQIILDRIEDDRRVIKELLFENAQSSTLKDGDVVNIRGIIDEYKNKVQISGAVYRPGNYEFTTGLALKDLIAKSSGIKERAYLDRGLIYRRKADGFSKESINFSVRDVLNGTTAITLQPNDEIFIFDQEELKDKAILKIDGEVRDPKEIPYLENLTVNDLVVIAGGFKDGANKEVIDVSREIVDDNFETLTETFRVNLDGSGPPFELQPNDRVSVRGLRGFSDGSSAQVVGEINFPGAYRMVSKNAKISDLVLQAGGLSPYAYLEGATLIRSNPYFKEENAQAVLTSTDTTSNFDLLNNKREFRLGINLEKIMSEDGKNSKYDLIIQDGDKLIIPSTKETVKVEGEILVPSLVRHDKKYSLKDYVGKSGGFSQTAKKGKAYVIYPNGDVATTKHFLFFRSYPKIEPGSVVLIPQKRERRGLSAQEVIGITSGITGLSLIVDRLFR